MGLKRLFDVLRNIGRARDFGETPTFRAVPEEGVGLFIVPNPRPRRQTLSGRVSGEWRSKLLHFTE